jgi:hypothetical protein
MSGNYYDKDGWDTDSEEETPEPETSITEPEIDTTSSAVPHIQTAAKVQASPLLQDSVLDTIRAHNQQHTQSATLWPTTQ